MKPVKLLVFIGVVVLLSSCTSASRVSTVNHSTPLPSHTEVQVLGEAQPVSPNARLMAQIKIGDSGFSVKCSYETALDALKKSAIACGANVVHIKRHKRPNFWSSCHRLEADAYLVK